MIDPNHLNDENIENLIKKGFEKNIFYDKIINININERRMV